METQFGKPPAVASPQFSFGQNGWTTEYCAFLDADVTLSGEDRKLLNDATEDFKKMLRKVPINNVKYMLLQKIQEMIAEAHIEDIRLRHLTSIKRKRT